MKKKIEGQSQEYDFHMYEELVIFSAFVILRIFNTQEKYISSNRILSYSATNTIRS